MELCRQQEKPALAVARIDRRTGQVLAYVFGRRKNEVFLQLKKLLEPFGIKHYCTDGWRAYKAMRKRDTESGKFVTDKEPVVK